MDFAGVLGFDRVVEAEPRRVVAARLPAAVDRRLVDRAALDREAPALGAALQLRTVRRVPLTVTTREVQRCRDDAPDRALAAAVRRAAATALRDGRRTTSI